MAAMLDGKRYLSEAAVKQMTSKQTPDALTTSYGFGWRVGKGEFGHGGAYATNMTIDTQRRLVLHLDGPARGLSRRRRQKPRSVHAGGQGSFCQTLIPYSCFQVCLAT